MIWRHGTRLGLVSRQESGWVPESLRKEGFEPVTVIDVGAGGGTPPLYQAFPDSYHVMIEPLEECRSSLDEHLTNYKGERIAVAVGERAGQVEINVDPDAHWNSSILERAWHQPGDSAKLVRREIPVKTLDELLEERSWTPPFGLKLDTEGYEAHVIAGATEVLKLTQFVIAEVYVSNAFREGSYTFAEFIALMDSRGFALLDILDGVKPAMNQGMVFLDALFARAS